MRIVMNHLSEDDVAIRRVFCSVEDMLVPELVEIILPIYIGPRHEHKARFHLQQSQETNIFRTGCLCSFETPSLLFHQRIAH